MKVRIVKPTIALKHAVSPGEELEVSQAEGLQLIGAKKAVAIKAVAAETTDKPMAEAEISAKPVAAETPEAPAAEAEPEVKAPRGKKKASEA